MGYTNQSKMASAVNVERILPDCRFGFLTSSSSLSSMAASFLLIEGILVVWVEKRLGYYDKQGSFPSVSLVLLFCVRVFLFLGHLG